MLRLGAMPEKACQMDLDHIFICRLKLLIIMTRTYLEGYPLGLRVANAGVSYVRYLAMTVWPAGLSIYYPYERALPGITVLAAFGLLAGISLLALRLRKTSPYFLVGWLWYLGTLVPVIGLVQVGQEPMADRYTYIPLIGLFVIVAWGVPDMLGHWRSGAR